jgi:hypothetical protein
MKEVSLAIETDEQTQLELKARILAATGHEPIAVKKENLDGSLASFLTILQAVGPILAATVPIIVELLKQRKVRRIKFNNIEVDNPTREQWEAIWARYEGETNVELRDDQRE